jgi:hypothetical protein
MGPLNEVAAVEGIPALLTRGVDPFPNDSRDLPLRRHERHQGIRADRLHMI